ncbi:hypothetical protein DQ04_15151000 [Trypanosoma grayi]|uniref:hypothetical protein n=1 Tax=Trypanosoma grayi TaxID=71804 RepID=UPI0004F46970|nr:hypothetical protein DQ04_15151000 [Trypanosoma grayi]KEG06223.1 hypothetical protein DQ04_15151000 [Trypanosoma grayi]
MIDPHLFCGPEFTLEVPAEHQLPLLPSLVLQLQTELYNLLSPAVRRKIHATHNSSSAAAVPPPPDSLLFVDVQPIIPQGSVKEDAAAAEGTIHLVLLVTDSRAAAELFLIVLRNPFIALPHRMRLRSRCTSSSSGGGGEKGRTPPAEILRRKEALRSRMNFDEDLWRTLQETLTPEWMQEFEAQHLRQHDGAAAMREAQRHEQRVESVLRYCEKEVQYVGVMDDAGKASPFLTAMGLFYRLGLTHRDALLHFARHPRRTVRAIALFIARYTVAPEELEPFFAPSITDEVVVACADDLQVTSSMRQLCADLLLCDEVCEAWPPTYHPHWIEHTVRPMMQRVEAECKRREELREARAGDGNKNTAAAAAVAAAAAKPGGGAVVRGAGTGVGVFGFRSIHDLQRYVREKERVLVPQRIVTMSAAARDGAVDGAAADLVRSNDNDDADDDDDDDFLIKVRLEGDDRVSHSSVVAGQGHGSRPAQQQQQQQQKKKDASRRKRQREATATNTRALVVTGAYRAVLRLLGRTEPFDKRSEHYLTF